MATSNTPRRRRIASLFIGHVYIYSVVEAFSTTRKPSARADVRHHHQRHSHHLVAVDQQQQQIVHLLHQRDQQACESRHQTILSASNGEDNNTDNIQRNVPNDLGLQIIRGTGEENGNEIPDDTWGDIEGSAPSRFEVVKNLLGINIFTYILAAFIIFFLSMNVFFGPGWLGQGLGWENVGTFTEVSDSLPLSVDVSGPEYLL
eukprot:g4006.t1 g4006   contig15:130509-131288(+)